MSAPGECQRLPRIRNQSTEIEGLGPVTGLLPITGDYAQNGDWQPDFGRVTSNPSIIR
jgi:hypothetical protein